MALDLLLNFDSFFQGKLYPEPRQYYHAPTEYDLKIPKSLPLVYAQMPFYLHGLTDTSEIKTLIGHIRDLSVKFEGYGLPNYPSGKADKYTSICI